MITQGKWEIVRGFDNILDYEKKNPDCITIRCNGWNIARIWTTVENNLLQVESNAALIAAAPDLLAACKMAEQCTHAGGIEGMSINDAAILVRDTLRAVIAKAENKADTKLSRAKELWQELRNIPGDSNDCIDIEWETTEHTFDLSVAEDLMGFKK